MIPLPNCFPPCQKVLLPHLSLFNWFLWSHSKPDQEKDTLLKTKSFNLIIVSTKQRVESVQTRRHNLYGEGVSDARGLKDLFITKESRARIQN